MNSWLELDLKKTSFQLSRFNQIVPLFRRLAVSSFQRVIAGWEAPHNSSNDDRITAEIIYKISSNT